MTDSAGLTGNTAAGHCADNIELIGSLGNAEGLTNDQLESLKAEVIVNVSAVDGDFACTLVDTNAGYRVLSSSCTIEKGSL